MMKGRRKEMNKGHLEIEKKVVVVIILNILGLFMREKNHGLPGASRIDRGF